MNRNALLTAGLDPARPGLEVGAYDSPVLERPRFNVLYADVIQGEALLEKCIAEGRSVSSLCSVDVVIGAAGLRAAIGDRRFSHVIASHVLEHIPDPLHWLADVHAMLDQDGVLALALPDHRKCFDLLRTPTSAGQWLDAYNERRSRPSSGQIFDSLMNTCNRDGVIVWDEFVSPDVVTHSGTPGAALVKAQEALAHGNYTDVHCWVFTAWSFLHLLRQFAVVGMFAYEYLDHSETGCEFIVRFRRLDPDQWARAVGSIPVGREGRYAMLPAGFSSAAYLRANPDLEAQRVDPVEHYIDHGRREGRAFE